MDKRSRPRHSHRIFQGRRHGDNDCNWRSQTVRVALADLDQHNPLKHAIWSWLDSPVTREEIASYIERKRFRTKPYPIFGEPGWSQGMYTRENEIARIAYLVVNPDPTPIQIYLSGAMRDGLHRLAAAFYRGDTHIHVDYVAP